MFIPSSPRSQSPSSPRALELGEQLALLARDYQGENPEVTGADLDAALEEARTQLRPESRRRCGAGGSAYAALVVAMIMLGGAYILTRFEFVTKSEDLASMLFIGMLAIGTVMISNCRRGGCG